MMRVVIVIFKTEANAEKKKGGAQSFTKIALYTKTENINKLVCI